MANDIIDINVYETVETVAITVNPNLTTVNINQATPVGVNAQNLQSVTDIGASTSNSITANSFIKSNGTASQFLMADGTTTPISNINSKQLQLNYLDRDNSIFDAFYLRTIADGGTVEASNQLLYSLAVLRNISYINQGYTQQINADKFVKLGGAADEYLMADGSISFGGGGGGGATNLAYTPSPTNGIVTSNTGTDATIPLADVTNAGLLTPSEKTKIANSVPYTGATSDVNLEEFGIQLGNLEFDNTPTNIPTAAGSMYYNDTDGTLDLKLKGGNVTLQIGQEQVARVVNKTATSITLLESNYQAVRITGSQGQRLKVDLAQATTDVLSSETIGLVTETIANNEEGFITTSGLVRGINTTGSLQSETWLDGDILYLSPTVAGRITKVKPTAPNHLIIIGYVIHAHITQGTIFVKVDNGYELDELHNVKITTPANNNVLAYTSATDIWENKSITTALGYTPYNAANPSGYQTSAQVQTIADAKVVQTITNGVTATAPSQDAVFDALAGKQATLVSATNIKTINGTTILGSGDLVLSGGSVSLSAIGATPNANGATITGSVLNLQPAASSFGGVVTAGTQTISGLKTFENGINVGLSGVLGDPDIQEPYNVWTTDGSYYSINGLQSSSIPAYSVIANNSNGTSTASYYAFRKWDLATYSLTPTWSGTTNPTVLLGNSYSGQQVGNMVSLNIALVYSAAGVSNTQVILPLPANFPTPLSPTGLTGALDIIAYGTGMILANTTSTAVTGARNILLRRNAANTGYEILMNISVAVAARVAIINLTYQVS